MNNKFIIILFAIFCGVDVIAYIAGSEMGAANRDCYKFPGGGYLKFIEGLKKN